MPDIGGEPCTPEEGPAEVVSRPMTGVKKQAAANYPQALVIAEFYALTFGVGHQGESMGKPRGLEAPHRQIEDNKAAVSY